MWLSFPVNPHTACSWSTVLRPNFLISSGCQGTALQQEFFVCNLPSQIMCVVKSQAGYFINWLFLLCVFFFFGFIVQCSSALRWLVFFKMHEMNWCHLVIQLDFTLKERICFKIMFKISRRNILFNLWLYKCRPIISSGYSCLMAPGSIGGSSSSSCQMQPYHCKLDRCLRSVFYWCDEYKLKAWQFPWSQHRLKAKHRPISFIMGCHRNHCPAFSFLCTVFTDKLFSCSH